MFCACFCVFINCTWSQYTEFNSEYMWQALVFDFGSEVYVWTGKDVSLSDRKVAVQLGKQIWSGAYDYSTCRVNPLDPPSANKDTPKWVTTPLIIHARNSCSLLVINLVGPILADYIFVGDVLSFERAVFKLLEKTTLLNSHQNPNTCNLFKNRLIYATTILPSSG